MPGIEPLVISAPFGNYVQPHGATATLGTFTAARRPGRLWRILRTVRYSRRMGAWINQIGLRNPGIDSLAQRVESGRVDASGTIVSIHGFTGDDWRRLLDRVEPLKPLAIELNMSCPNIGEIDWPEWLFAEAASAGHLLGMEPWRVIAKLPPVNYRDMLGQALEAGIRAFHCCNTLPVPRGGVSGKPLLPVSLACIRDVLDRAGVLRDELLIIGGGGITGPADIDAYADAGARRFAVGTKVMNPRYLVSDAGLRAIMQRACERAID